MKRLTALIVCLIALASTAVSAKELTAGTKEISGTGACSILSNDGFAVYTLGLAPSLRFYLTPQFNIGPQIDYTFSFSDFHRISDLAIGPSAAFVLLPEKTVHPYVDFGGSFLYSWSSFDLGGTEGWKKTSAIGVQFPLEGGVKIRTGESFFTNLGIGTNIRIVEGELSTITSLGFGFSGIF